ncbi:MAG TPA: class I SAM-dependent methyltransferase [Sphingomicrobium sp.]|nr:class I SAM-dependent methyltransferase [Sphingomicrobium sp.]
MIYDEVADFAEKRQFVKDFLDYLAPFSEGISNWRTLEIGGGGGVLAALLAQHFGTVLSTDIVNPNFKHDGRLTTLLAEKFERNSEMFRKERIEFLAADAQRLQFRDNWFDLCFSQNALEHIPDPEMAFREAVRVTRPGGMVYFQFDPVWTADSGSHFVDQIGEPWLHLLEEDDALIARMSAAGADSETINAFQKEMNRRPISYYREMFPRVIRQLNLEIIIHHEWSGTIDQSWTEHPNLLKAAAAVGLPPQDLLVRGLRYLVRVPIDK